MNGSDDELERILKKYSSHINNQVSTKPTSSFEFTKIDENQPTCSKYLFSNDDFVNNSKNDKQYTHTNEILSSDDELHYIPNEKQSKTEAVIPVINLVDSDDEKTNKNENLPTCSKYLLCSEDTSQDNQKDEQCVYTNDISSSDDELPYIAIVKQPKKVVSDSIEKQSEKTVFENLTTTFDWDMFDNDEISEHKDEPIYSKYSFSNEDTCNNSHKTKECTFTNDVSSSNGQSYSNYGLSHISIKKHSKKVVPEAASPVINLDESDDEKIGKTLKYVNILIFI